MSTKPQPSLPTWSVGSATNTLFRDDSPSGTEFKVFNRMGGTPDQLIAQANAAAAMLAALRECERLAADIGDSAVHRFSLIYTTARAAIADATARTTATP